MSIKPYIFLVVLAALAASCASVIWGFMMRTVAIVALALTILAVALSNGGIVWGT